VKSVSWSYHRENCNTCRLTQEFLTGNSVPVAETVNARKTRIAYDDALALARRASEIVSTRGKSVKRIKNPSTASNEEIAALIIGPSGNLRAPAFFVGKRLVIGFQEDVYRELLT